MRKSRFAAFAAALLLFWPAAGFAASSPRTLSGHVPPQIRTSTRLDRLAADENVELSLVVGIDQALMDRTLAELYGPNAPANPHFLTSEEFTQKFDLVRKRQALKDFAAASGLTVKADEDNPHSLVVKVSGPSSRVENAFSVRLHHYRAADGQIFRGHDTEPTIPGELAPHLHAVLGLSNYRGAAKPHLRNLGPALGAARAPGGAGVMAAGAITARPASCEASSNCPGSGIGGVLTPTDIKTIYGLSLPVTGTGQKIALMELDGYAASDITAYETAYSLPSTPVTFVSVGGQANKCGPNQADACDVTTLNGGQADQTTGDGGMTEVALDVDMVLSLASGVSEIRMYTATNSGAGIVNAYQAIATDNLAKSVSTSWGLDEKDSGGAFMASETTIFQQMAAQGQSMFAATGDAGAYDNDGASTPLIVVTDDPASQPFVTAVGGTSLSGTVATHSEVVWNEGCASPGTGCKANGAGGGGIANYSESGTAYWPLPSYQNGVVGSASQVYRNIPDVALNADPLTFPYGVYVGGAFYYVGGTSAAAPLWAAATALINQKRAAGSYAALGFFNSPIYSLGTGASYSTYFNDIVSGNNGAYSAGVGYDNASGWGSFKADALINVLSAPFAPSNPVTNLAAVTLGQTSIQYTWTNTAGATGYNVYYATNTAQVLATATNSPYTQTGLIGNEISGVIVHGENQGVEGPGASITTATYAAAPAAVSIATGWSSSATFTFAACPAFPNPSSCSGYSAQVSTAANFTGTLFSSATPNRTLTTLSTTGLAPNTGYYVRLAALNALGGPAYGPSIPFNTSTNLVAPTLPTFTQIATGTIVFGWNQATNPGGILYNAQTSTAANYSGTLSTYTGTALSAAFGGLFADASYYFQAAAVGGPAMNAGPQATLAAPPVALANAFSAVGAAGLTVSWSAGFDQSDTLYQADISPVPTFLSGVISQQVRAPAATFGGLVANTPYYARVEAIGRLGGIAGPVPLGSTTTLVQAPTLPGQPFSGQTTNGFSFTFNTTDPPGTRYLVQVSTDPAFSVINASSNTASTTASFAGLISNQSYTFQVAGINQAGSLSAFAISPATATLAAVPLLAPVPVTTYTATTFGFAWAAGTLASGTTFAAQVSSSPVFNPGFVLTVSTTGGTSLKFSGLQPNTTYYGQVQSKPGIGNTNPSSAFLAAATGATLPIAPSAVATPFVEVAFTSATVAWKPLPLAPSSAAAEGYLVQFATAPDFTTIAASSAVAPGAASAVVGGITYGIPYFARVGAVGWEGGATFLTLGSTTTAVPPLSSGTVTTSGLSLLLPPAFSQLTSVGVYVPPGAFPPGTVVSVLSTLGSNVAGGRSNESGAITPFGPTVGIDLSAGGLQPSVPVRVTMGYDPTQIPPGMNEKQLLLWRYDVPSAQWTLVPSADDPKGHTLTAYTPHFSTFAPFFVAAGTDVSAVQVFPQPWEIGDAASQYWSSVLTFSGLPASATVKIFTIAGELVWSGTAAGSGVLTWDGNSRFGRRVASGTYYAAFQNGGQTKIRRVVIIR